jgi:ABC-type sugar transport system ATPase subunit
LIRRRSTPSTSPPCFCFDQLLSKLDAKFRGRRRIEIKQHQQRLGSTGIHVTDDQVEAMQRTARRRWLRPDDPRPGTIKLAPGDRL